MFSTCIKYFSSWMIFYFHFRVNLNRDFHNICKKSFPKVKNFILFSLFYIFITLDSDCKYELYVMKIWLYNKYICTLNSIPYPICLLIGIRNWTFLSSYFSLISLSKRMCVCICVWKNFIWGGCLKPDFFSFLLPSIRGYRQLNICVLLLL